MGIIMNIPPKQIAVQGFPVNRYYTKTESDNKYALKGSASSLTVQDIDGSPTVNNVTGIKFTNGSVTDNGDGTVTVTTGSGGGGDVSSNTALSVDSEIALFSGTGGKTIKRATGTGIATLTSGVLSVTATTGSGSVVLATSPTLVTPILGVAAVTSINKLTITTPATGSTLTIDDGFTLHTTGNVTALSGSHTGTSSGTNTGDQTSVSGNAGTATALQTSRNINGVAFDGTANITVTAAAGTLTGTTLNSTVVTSSLTSLGTITTGVWNGTVIAGQYGGTGVANTGKTITLGGNLTTSGAYAATFTLTNTTSVTLPTTGTLATLAGSESLTNKSVNGVTLTTAGSSTKYLSEDGTYTTPSGGGGSMAIGGTVTSGTAGSILFVGSGPVLAQDNTNFFWDATNANLRLGPTSAAISTENRLSVIGNANDYHGIFVQNLSSGTTASTDIVVGNNLSAADPTTFADFGINSSGNTNPSFTGFGASDAYLFTSGQVNNLVLATGVAAKDIVFLTGGTLTANERFRITGAGNFIANATVTTGTGATAGFQLKANALTTGNGLDVSSTSLTTGNLVKFSSTSTAAGSNIQTVLNIATSGANGTSTQTTYGAQFANTHTGTSATNIGAYFTASGGSTNLAINTPSSGGTVLIGGSTLGGANNLKLQVGQTSTFVVAPDFSGANGEAPAGSAYIGSGSGNFVFFPDNNGGTAGKIIMFGYFNGAVKSAIEIANVSSGFGTLKMMRSGGFISIGNVTATAQLHIAAGSATASTAPLKFTSGTNLTTPEAGAMEYNGTNLFFTRTGTTRESVFVGVSGASAPSTSVGATIVNYYGSGATNFLGDPNSWASVVIAGTTYKIPLYT